MRSGSSLITHILGANRDISGYGETHLRYSSEADLQRLMNEVLPTLRKVCVPKYVMDKVLGEYLNCDQLFHRSDCFFVFFIRHPDASIRSMMRQFPTWFGEEPLDHEMLLNRALQHYERRLTTIERHASLVADTGRAAFFTHNQLINNTSDVFRMLERMLSLSLPLEEKYSVMRTTGVPGVGDQSHHITKGFIDRTINHEDRPLDENAIAHAIELYERVSDQLTTSCLSI